MRSVGSVPISLTAYYIFFTIQYNIGFRIIVVWLLVIYFDIQNARVVTVSYIDLTLLFAEVRHLKKELGFNCLMPIDIFDVLIV